MNFARKYRFFFSRCGNTASARTPVKCHRNRPGRYCFLFINRQKQRRRRRRSSSQQYPHGVPAASVSCKKRAGCCTTRGLRRQQWRRRRSFSVPSWPPSTIGEPLRASVPPARGVAQTDLSVKTLASLCRVRLGRQWRPYNNHRRRRRRRVQLHVTNIIYTNIFITGAN